MIDNRDIEDIYELSPLQKGMLYHNLESNEKDFYCEQTTLTLEGGISLSHIQNAFDGLIKKYVVLRTNFLYNNLRKPVQIVWVNKENIIEYKDISKLDKEQKVKYLEDFKEKDRLRGFDLSTDALIRLSILKIDSKKFKLILSHHHIIMDGWCFGIILNDLFEMYKCSIQNKKINVDNTTPYSKYIKWLENLDHKESIDYWRDYLRGIEQHTQIPAQNSLSINHNYIRSEKSIIFSEELTRNLKILAGDLKVTLNTVLQCIWGILLQRYTGTNDVTFGSVVSGRSPEISGIEKMVGLFINTVPVRIQTQEGTFKNLVREVQKRVLDSEKYNYTPIVDIQNCLESRQLFDHIFVFENYPLDLNIFNRQKDLGFKVSNIEVYEKSNYNFNILILPGNEFEIKIIFNGEKYQEQFIDDILNQIKFITSQIISDPNLLIGELELISQNTISEIKNHEFPNKSVHEIFEEQVKRFPNKIAIRIEDQSLTYDELNKRANQLARFLLNKGVGQGDLVGISMLRCFDLYIGMLAILKIGAAYVPVETSYPQQRLIQLVRDSKISVFITKDDLTLDTKELTIIDIDEYTKDIKKENELNLQLPIFGNELAYVMFTSGSTGKPKGILTTHQNIISRVYNSNYVEINEMDKILQLSNCTFDGSSFDIYSSLLNGGELVVVQEDKLLNISYLSELIENKGITITFITTALFNKIVDLNITCLKNLKNILFGGEKASIKHVIKAVKVLGENRLIHVYGPTETTIFATYFLIDYSILNSKRVPIGQPINDTQIYILDSNLKPVPRGIQGEIYIGGRGVAQGYLNSSELTDKHFIPNLFDDSKTRLYKTGDLGCFLPDGNVEFLGRIDNQVKIRGYRVEIEEIENLILQHSYVKEAAINIVGDMNLIAYITLHKDINKNTINWKKYFLERLPHYMVPTHIIEMEKMPLTSNGKLDRKALPLPEIQSVEEYVAPTNEIEKSIEKMWREILETDQISIHANFFELGGHSLKAMMLVSRISKQFQVQVPINEIFSRPTIKELSEYVQRTDEKTYLPTIERVEHQKYYPASSVQKRLHSIHHIDETKMTYNMPMVLSIEGALDIKRLEGALQTIVSRHDPCGLHSI
ncbi:amino acid adenylation domain-containing protein [Bacillus pumilus]|nr:amino acid adenylation domain-containing protein [Bacillus pumilus]WOP22952.1 amino acid adenylation domain-containing protein [Bacillus pumilus]